MGDGIRRQTGMLLKASHQCAGEGMELDSRDSEDDSNMFSGLRDSVWGY